jgi:hypothetical protein
MVLTTVLIFVAAYAVAGSEDVTDDEERQIVQMLDMLENYDLIRSLEMYMNMNDIENMNREDKGSGNEAGEREVEK